MSENGIAGLGDITSVELPDTSADYVDQGVPIGANELATMNSDFNAIVRCKILQSDTLLEETPSMVTAAPEGNSSEGGWVARVELDEEGAKQVDELMDQEAYLAFTAE